MVKKNLGRNKINVIDSVPYSELIFLVSSGVNYPLSIAEARGKKDSSPTAKQLNQLVDRGFLKSNKEKLLNKTIFSINWGKISREFFNHYFQTYQKMMLEMQERFNIAISKMQERFNIAISKVGNIEEDIDLSDLNIVLKDKEEKEIIEDENILFLLRAFIETENILNKSTLRSIFERISRLILSDKEIFKYLSLKNNSLNKFLEVLKIVESKSVGIQDEAIKEIFEIKLFNKKQLDEDSLIEGFKNQYIFQKIMSDEQNKEYLGC